MSDYISREAAIQAICRDCIDTLCCGVCEDTDAIRRIPAADVRPVVRGKWVPVGTDDMDEGMFKCSECGSEHFFPEILLGIPADNYCPNCGCAMEGTE